jgi:type II secretory pathway component HofQ
VERRCTALHGPPRYRPAEHDPKTSDVRYPCAAAAWLGISLTCAIAHGQTGAAGELPALPLTQLDESVLAAEIDRKALTLSFAQPVPVAELFPSLVRGTTLSIVANSTIEGTFVGELKHVSVRQALALILPPLGLEYHVEGSIIRVNRRQPEMRLFDVNYLATTRTGSTVVGGGAATVATSTTTDAFSELAAGVKALLSDRGTFNVDRRAGLLQVTDLPERLDRVGVYLDTLHDRVHRQVQIDMRIVEVELNDADAQGLDWTNLAAGERAEGETSKPNIIGLRVADATELMAGMAAQGRVSVVAAPRLLALNNEPALVRATTDAPGARPGQRPALGSVTLEVTPQIASDGAITLSLSPIVTLQDADGGGGAPAVVTIREADTTARIASGETLVLGGFTRQRETRERQNAGVRGGWFGRTTVVTRKRIELVVMLTPRIVHPVGTP